MRDGNAAMPTICNDRTHGKLPVNACGGLVGACRAHATTTTTRYIKYKHIYNFEIFIDQLNAGAHKLGTVARRARKPANLAAAKSACGQVFRAVRAQQNACGPRSRRCRHISRDNQNEKNAAASASIFRCTFERLCWASQRNLRGQMEINGVAAVIKCVRVCVCPVRDRVYNQSGSRRRLLLCTDTDVHSRHADFIVAYIVGTLFVRSARKMQLHVGI